MCHGVKNKFKKYQEDKTHKSKKVERLSNFLCETKERYQRNRGARWGEETTSIKQVLGMEIFWVLSMTKTTA